jgi:hypothetical protein
MNLTADEMNAEFEREGKGTAEDRGDFRVVGEVGKGVP